jgi:hypothetical protein
MPLWEGLVIIIPLWLFYAFVGWKAIQQNIKESEKGRR